MAPKAVNTVDLTTVAEAALDAALPSGKLSIAGDQITMKQAVDIVEQDLQLLRLQRVKRGAGL